MFMGFKKLKNVNISVKYKHICIKSQQCARIGPVMVALLYHQSKRMICYLLFYQYYSFFIFVMVLCIFYKNFKLN